jgi:Fe-S-cluster containining protein
MIGLPAAIHSKNMNKEEPMRVPGTKAWLKAEYGQRPDLVATGVAIADKLLTRLNTVWNRSKISTPSYPERYRELLQVADEEIDGMIGKVGEIPCRLGCNFCCKDERIPMTEREAELAVRHIEERLDPQQKARVVESILASSPTSDQANAPCAFLIDERCAIYESRPLACRTYFSHSVASCNTFFLDKAKVPQRFTAPKLVEIAVREVTRAAKHSKLYETNSLMKRIYSDPGKPAKWQAGQMTDESDLADPE